MTIMRRATSGVVLFLVIASVVQSAARQEAPVPDKLVVLTFDDSAKSHATYVAPRLKKLGFGATFFITEGFDFPTNKTSYMTWEEIAGLHKMGFEIGNHTAKHANAARQTREALTADLELIERRCVENGIPRPVSFAYPGNDTGGIVVEVLKERGYRFARRGGAPEFPMKADRASPSIPGSTNPSPFHRRETRARRGSSRTSSARFPRRRTERSPCCNSTAYPTGNTLGSARSRSSSRGT